MSAPRQFAAVVAAVAAIALAVSLGSWQLRRADEKLALQAQWDRAERAEPVSVSGASVADIAPRLPLRVTLRGRFLPGREVWLDNRQMDGRAGLMLIAPLQLGDGAVILVNRGFAARDPRDRRRLPEPIRPDGEVAIEGLAVAQTSRVFSLGDDAPVAGSWPLVWQNLDFDAYEHSSGLVVARWVVQQTGGEPDGLQRNWPWLAAGADRHRGYAVQWYSLAGLITVLMLILGLRALRRRAAPLPSDD